MCRRSRSRPSQVLARKDFNRIKGRGKDSRKEEKKAKKEKDRKRAVGGWSELLGARATSKEENLALVAALVSVTHTASLEKQ